MWRICLSYSHNTLDETETEREGEKERRGERDRDRDRCLLYVDRRILSL